ncbi:MAG: tail fiber domain-containing protein [Sphingobium sp.]
MAVTGMEMADLVREVCFDGGAGPLVLGGAVAGYRTFADAVSEGAAFPYMIVREGAPVQWEAGTGTLDGEGRLVRAPYASSADGAAVDFAAGEKIAGIVLHGGWAQAVEAHGHGIAGIDGLAAALAGKQAANAELSAIAALATTGFGRGALALADAAAFRSYIGAGTSNTAGTVTSVAGAGGTTGLTLSGGPITASGTLTLGGTLAVASGGTGATSATAARTALGLGTIATQGAGAVAITGGAISGITDLAVADGGTGASSASAARNNLGLGTAATLNSGTSGGTVPLLNGANSWSGAQAFADATLSGTMVAGGTSAVQPLSLGGSAMTPKYQSQGTSISASGQLVLMTTDTASSAPHVIAARQRATGSVVLGGDRLGVFAFNGHDGVALRSAAAIVGDAAADFSSGNAYGTIRMLTANGSGTPSEVARFEPAQSVFTGPVLFGGTSGLTILSQGGAPITPNIQIQGTNATTSAFTAISTSNTAASAPYFTLGRRRSSGAPLILNGDRIGDFAFNGHDGSDLRSAAVIRVEATADFSAGAAHARMSFWTANGGNPVEAMRIDGSGVSVSASVYPSTDNARALGGASTRWSVVYAATGTINTSDVRDKRDVGAVGAAMLDAWGQVEWARYRFEDAFAAKGEAARWHVGLVAQQVQAVIDAQLGAGAAVRLGLLCHDRWDASDAEVDEAGAVVRPGRAAGERWGLRYEECFALEAAWQRRRIERIEAALAGLAGEGANAG